MWDDRPDLTKPMTVDGVEGLVEGVEVYGTDGVTSRRKVETSEF